MGKLSRRGLGAMVASGLSLPYLARAADWPTRPLTLLVPYPPGGNVDGAARILAAELQKTLPQPIVVENRPGGQNVIGTQAAARSAPDGYNFFYATTAAMVTNGFTFKTLPFDLEKDFIPVALLGRSPFVLAAQPNTGGMAPLAPPITMFCGVSGFRITV